MGTLLFETLELRELAIRALIACVAVTWLVILWRSHRDPALANFSFAGLIMTRDGYIDRVAVMELGSWVAMTLVIITLTAHDRLTEMFATIYVAFPAVRAGQSAMLRAGAPVPASSTTTTEASTTTRTSTTPATPAAKKSPGDEQ